MDKLYLKYLYWIASFSMEEAFVFTYASIIGLVVIASVIIVIFMNKSKRCSPASDNS